MIIVKLSDKDNIEKAYVAQKATYEWTRTNDKTIFGQLFNVYSQPTQYRYVRSDLLKKDRMENFVVDLMHCQSS